MQEQAAEEDRNSRTPDARLVEALRPAVDAALLHSVRHEPRVWAEALFPVLLPAVGIAVASALRGMLQTLNQVLEHSLTVRSWKWRFEAWRTGKTFGEVVLLRTLVFRVEQLLLMDRRSGLLLAAAADPAVVPRDQQQISAMLTALQDFVSDSFALDPATGIREIHVGDFCVLVEMGPRAALAAAVRGNAPAELRETLRAAIDLIHQEFAAELRDFRDDAKPFTRSCTILEGCLQAHYQESQPQSSTRVWVMAAFALVTLAAWMGLRTMDARRWERALAELHNAPGIEVTASSDRVRGQRVLRGLADPLARRPEAVLRENGIDLDRVSVHFQPYLSLDPELVVKRARVVLDAPGTVTTSLDGGALQAKGTAPHEWILRARNASPQLTFLGVRAVRVDQVVDQEMEALRAGIESDAVLFDVDSSQFTPDQARAGKSLAARLRQWVDYSRELGWTPRVTVVGYADPTGTELRNAALSRERAERLGTLLSQEGVPPDILSIEHRRQSTDAGTDPALQRRASIRLSQR